MPKGGWLGQEVRRKTWTPRQDHAAVPRTPVAKRCTDSSLIEHFRTALRASVAITPPGCVSAPLRTAGTRTRRVTRDCRARERGHRLRFDSAPLDTGPGATDPFGASWALRRRPRSRAAPLRTTGSPRAAAVLGRGDAERPQPAQVQGGAGEVPLVAHLRHAAEDEATKAIARWISACRRKTCRSARAE